MSQLLNELEKVMEKVRKLVEENERLRREVAKLRKQVEELAAAALPSPVNFCDKFVADLAEHGLLSEAKKWLKGEENILGKYIVGDDAYYEIILCRKEILETEKAEGEEKKEMIWVI